MASDLADIETRLRSTALPAMPDATAWKVSTAIDHATATLRSLVIDYVSLGQELRVRTQAIRSDALSWLTPAVETPVWFTRWFIDEIVRGGVAPFSAASSRDAVIGRFSYVLSKHPEDILRWFTNVDAVTAAKSRGLDRIARRLNVLVDPLERRTQLAHYARLRDELRGLKALRGRWLGRIRALGAAGLVYGTASHAAHSDAGTGWGKGLSTGINFALTKSPTGTLANLATGGGLSTSADFYAITAETIVDPDLENYRAWTEGNLRGDNGWLFRLAAQIPENGEYLADYTYDRWTWFPVDEQTGETRFEWRPWKWDD